MCSYSFHDTYKKVINLIFVTCREFDGENEY